MGQVGWSGLWSESKDVFFQNGVDGMSRKGKINWREGVPQTRDTTGKQLRSASVENEVRFSLDGSDERVLAEQKENGCKMGRL